MTTPDMDAEFGAELKFKPLANEILFDNLTESVRPRPFIVRSQGLHGLYKSVSVSMLYKDHAIVTGGEYSHV